MAEIRLRGQRATDARGAQDGGVRPRTVTRRLPAVGRPQVSKRELAGGARRRSHERLQPAHVLDRGLDQLPAATNDGAEVPLVEAEVLDKLPAAGELAVGLGAGGPAASRKVVLLGGREERGEGRGKGLPSVARPVRDNDAAIEEADGGSVEAAGDKTEGVEVGVLRQLDGQSAGRPTDRGRRHRRRHTYVLEDQMQDLGGQQRRARHVSGSAGGYWGVSRVLCGFGWPRCVAVCRSAGPGAPGGPSAMMSPPPADVNSLGLRA